jgi:hypothetical protein
VSTPAPRQVWRELLAADPQALPTQSPEWVDCVCSEAGYVDASRLYETADGRRALLPMVRRAHGREWTASRHSMPASWGFGGLVADGEVTADLVGSVVDDLAGLRSLRVHVRPNPLHAESWAAAMSGRPGVTVIPARAHVLDLTGGFEEVWGRRFRSSTRRHVRQAESRGVQVETDTTGRLVPEFYELLRRSTDRWAEHQREPAWLAQLRRGHRDPLKKFQAMAASLGGAWQLSVARYDGRPAAAILVLRGRNAHYTRGAMDEALAGPTQANKLLHKVAIEDACRSGCAFYHMGESGESDGLSQFKSRFGAEPHRYAEYWIERLPLKRADQWLRRGVKRAIGFRDV